MASWRMGGGWMHLRSRSPKPQALAARGCWRMRMVYSPGSWSASTGLWGIGGASRATDPAPAPRLGPASEGLACRGVLSILGLGGALRLSGVEGIATFAELASWLASTRWR